VNSQRLRLHACSDDGQLESNQIADFEWSTQYFIFEYKRSTMKVAKPVKLQTLFPMFMYDCFECILRELQISNNLNPSAEGNS
jgi:hypothetical protein